MLTLESQSATVKGSLCFPGQHGDFSSAGNTELTTRAGARVTMVTRARRVTRARAGHPKSRRPPLRVYITFQANMANMALRQRLPWHLENSPSLLKANRFQNGALALTPRIFVLKVCTSYTHLGRVVGKLCLSRWGRAHPM